MCPALTHDISGCLIPSIFFWRKVYFTALFVLQACSVYSPCPGQGTPNRGGPAEWLLTLAWGQAAARVTGDEQGTCGKGKVFPGENQVQVWPCHCANSSILVTCVAANGKSLSDFWASALLFFFSSNVSQLKEKHAKWISSSLLV